MSRPRTVGAFVRARRAAWDRLDALAARAAKGRLPLAEVEELDRLYRRAAGDLAFARVAFPGSDAEGHLAQVTARAYGTLYRPERAGLASAWRLYAVEAPAAFRRNLRAFGLAAALLAAGLAGGALAVLADPGAAEVLVPRGVRDAVAAGRLWTDDLLTAAPGFTGSVIARNNVAVAALAFGLGLTAGVGTALLVVANGLVLGAVFAHLARHGMVGGLAGFVAAHGPAELSALLLAAQAGFVLASALVDPGESPRGLALAARGREAVRLVAVVIPVLLLVGLVEGGVSPGARFPAAAKAALGLALAGGLFVYLSLAGERRGHATRGAGGTA
ncbi:MAG: stage II sporulation protein M [Anaeromyxobacteraceae bacterium]